MEVRGKENLKSEKSCILVCNHQSSLDLLGKAYIYDFVLLDQFYTLTAARHIYGQCKAKKKKGKFLGLKKKYPFFTP